MIKHYKVIFAIFFLFAFSYISQASHIVGGSLTYVYNGGSNYTVTLKLYRDCAGVALPGSVTITVVGYNGDPFTPSKNFTMNLASSSFLPSNLDSCAQAPSPIPCVQEGIYTTTINTLPPNPGGYHMYYQVIARNTGITNVNATCNCIGESFYAYIPGYSVSWLEDFTLPNGTILDTGATAWTRTLGATPPNSAQVNNNLFEINGANNAEATWTSQVIDISTLTLGANLSVNLSEASNVEPNDSILVYYSLDGGSLTLFSTNGAMPNDFTNAIASETGLIGTTVQIVIRVHYEGNSGGEIYRFDNVVVSENDFVSNNSPVFNQFPPLFLCVGNPFTFNHSASDANGDSLVYSFYTPYDGDNNVGPLDPTFAGNIATFTPVIWQPGFSATNPLGGAALSLDSSTGLLSGTPTIQGQFVVGIMVKEYRNGVYLSEVLRDVQFNVIPCPPPAQALITPTGALSVCNGNSLTFPNASDTIANNWLWNFGDLTTTNDTSSLEFPTYAYPGLGTYTAQLIINAGTSCADTATAVVTVTTPPADPTTNGDTICSGMTTTLTATAPGGTYEWYDASSGGTLLFTGASYATPVLVATTTYYVQTTVNGCTSSRTSVTVTVSPIPAAPTASGTTICSGTTATVSATAPGGTYEWYDAASGGTLLFTGASYTTPVLVATTTYYVQTTVVGCTGTRTAVTVTVNPIPAAPTASGTTICSGNTATVTATAPGGTYEWYDAASGGTLLFTGAGYTTPVLVATTTYYVQTTVGGCTGTRTAVTVTVNPTPVAPTASGTTICSGTTATITATAPGGTYEWYDAASGGTLLFTGAGYTTPVLVATTTYYVQTTVGGCAGTRTAVTVTVNPIPAAPTASGTTICSGTTATVTATAPGGTYEWYDAASGGTLLFTGAGYTTPVLVATTTYYVQTTVGGCTGTRTAVTVTVNPIPSAPTANGTTICSGNTATVTATAPGGTYEWYDAASGGTLLFTGAGYTTPVLVATTTYYVQTTVGGCTGTRTAVTVTVNPIPSAPTANGTTICSGNTATVTATAPGGTYEWYDAASGGTLLFTGAGYTTPILVATTTYYVQTTVGGCTGTRTAVTVTVNPIPAAPIASGTTICTGTTATLTATAPGGTYEWYDASSGGTLLFTGAGYTTPVLVATTTYYIQTTVGGCISPRTAVTVTVSPVPAAPTAAGVGICTGTSATITATAPGGTYAWYDAASGGTLLITNASYTTPVLVATTTYYVQTTVAGCAGPRTAVTVTVSPVPAAPTASGTTICSGTTATVTATAPGGTYEWYDAASGGTLLFTGAGYTTPILVATTTYYVQANVSGCIGPRTAVTVTVNPIPAAPTASGTTICSGTTATVTATAPGGTYEWYDAASGGTLLFTGASYTTPVLVATTTYYVQTTIGGCTGTRTAVTVTVNPIPAAPTASGTTICSGNTATVTATAPGGTYRWYNAAVGGTLLFTGASYTTSVLVTTTTYYVQTTVGGCISPRTAVTVTVNPTPAAPTASGTTICFGTTATITATAPGGTYEWYNAASGGALLFTGAGYTTPVLVATTTYYVQTTVGGCTGTRTAVTVTVNPIPAAPTASGTTICSGNTATVTATAPGGTYEWYDAASGGTLLFTGAGYTTPVLVATTTYYVQTTIGGCTGTRTAVTITVNPIPAAPTANGTTICSGNTATVTATAPGGTYAWYDAAAGGTLLFTGANYTTPVLAVTTTYYVQTTVSGCISPRTVVTVTVDPTPVAPTASGTTICEGNTATVTATAPGGTYEWYNAASGGTLLFTGAGYTTPVLVATTTYYVQTTVGSCTGTRTAVVVTVTPTDDPSFNYSSGTYCVTGTNPTPTITGGFGGTFSATPAGLTINPATGTITLSSSVLNTYVVTFTTNGPCPDNSSVNITITNAPSATFSYTTPICQSGGNELPSFPLGSSGGLFSAAPVGLVFVNTSTGEINTSASTFGAYTITNFIDTAGGCAAASANFSVTIDQAATVNAGTYSDICSGTTLNLSGTIGGSAGSATWSGGTGTYAPDANTLNATYTPSAGEQTAGIVTLILTTNDPAGFCSAVADTVSINIIPLPVAPTASGTTICEGESTTLTATAPGGNYEWYDALTGGTLLFTGASYTTGILTSTTTYYVQTTVNGCAGSRTSVTVNVTPLPVAPTASGTTICSGNTATVTATAPGGVYEWFDAAVSGTLLDTGASYTTPVLTSTDTFYVQTTVSGCTGLRTTVIVTVNPIPSAPIVGNQTICNGSSTTLTATAPGGTYEWYDAASGGTLLFTGAGYTTPILVATTTYYVQTTVSGCTSARTPVIVTVNPIPAAPTANGTTICEGNTATLTATAPGATYRWYSAASGGTLLATGANYTTPVLSTTTTYYVQTTISGCTSTRTAVTVTVILNDDPTFAYSSGTYCITGSNPTPTISGTSGGTFSVIPAGLTLNSTTGEINLASSALGTYTITYTTNGACPLSSSVSITITTAPDATFSFNDPYCQLTVNPFPTFPSGSSAGVFSAAPAGLNFVNTGTGEIDLSTSAAGTYTVTNFIAAAGGCDSATYSTTVVIEEAATVNAGSNQTICVGATVTLNGSFGGIATGATWSGGFGIFNPDNSTMNVVYTPTAGEYAAGIVNIILTTNDPGGICTAASDTITILFNEDDPSFNYSSGTYCATGTNPVASITGGSTGTFSATPAGLVFVNASTGEINLAASTLGTYNVTFTTDGTCPASSSMNITITNGFDATFSYNTPVCQSNGNEVPTFSPGASAGLFSALPSGLVFVNTSTGEIDVAGSALGTYTVTNFIAASGGCASATHSTTFTIDPPAIVNAGTDVSICSGENAALSGSIGGSTSSTTWSGGLGLFSPNNTDVNATYTPDPSETLVTLFLTTDNPANSCSAVEDTVIITIKPLPVAPTANGTAICSGTSATLTATAPGGSYQWFSNPIGGGSLFNGASFNTPILVATTTYYVQTTVNGCSSSSRTPVIVTVIPIDDPSFNYSPSTYCISGGNATPTITGGSAGTFTATPSGLVFADSSTGEIDVAATTLGTYTITFITDGACLDSATFDVTITNAPDATFSYNNPYCASGNNPLPTFPLGASAGQFTSTPVGLVFVNANTGQVNLSASTPGIYTVTNDIVAAGGCAPATYSDTIEILPTPIVDAGTDASICETSAQITLNGSVSNAGGMVWSTSGDGTFSPDSISSTVDFFAGSNDITNGATTIYLTSTQNGVCNAVTDSIIITIDQAPIVDAGLDLTACVGDNVNLSGSIGGSASSATWSGGLGTFSPNNTDVNATYTPDSSETLVILILTTDDPSGSCAAIADTVTIIINPLPAAPTASDDTICEGTSTTLTATAPGGSYQWFSNPTGGSSLFNGATFNTPILTNTTIYYLQTTVSGCSSDTRTPVTVTINPTDDPSFNYSPSTYCVSGGNATPTITGGSTGAFTATPSGLVFADSSTGEIDVLSTTLGTYTITFTTNGQCPDSATFDVTITNAPDATFSYNNPYCASGSNPFPTFPIGASAGVFTATPVGLVFVSTNTGQVNLSASTPGIYTVTNDIAASGGCVQAIYSDTIEILPAPTVDAGVDTSICANNSQIVLNGSVSNAGGMVWSTSGDGSFSPDSISSTVDFVVGSNDITNGFTTIYLTSTQNGVCNAVTDSIIITINPAPIVDAGNDILICDGTLTTILNGSVSGGASSGMWTSLGTGTFSPNNTTLNASYTLSLLDSVNGEVQLILESTNNGGCLTVYDTLDVFLSSPATVFAGIDTTVCVNNSSVQLGGIITGGTGEGIWSSLGGGTFIPTANDLNASYQLDSIDIANGFVTLILDAVNSCVPASDTIVITVNPVPVVDAGNNITICKSESASLNGNISFADGGQWTSNGTGSFVPNDTTLNATYVPSSADISLGTLELVLTSYGNGTCNAVSDTVNISFNESPVANFSTTGSCEADVVQFNDSSTIATGSITDYAWDFGNGDTSSVQNPTSTYATAGTYTVTLMVTSNSGCNDTVSNVITINPLPIAAFSYVSSCTTDTVLFTDNSTVATGLITGWDWDFGDLTTSILQNPSHGFGIIDTFSVTLTVTSDSGCTAFVTQDVIVAPQPTVDFGYVVNCENSTVTFTDSSSAAAGDVIVAYLWTFGNGNTSILQNPTPETYTSGSYLVQLQITTQAGCTTVDTATINIAAAPIAAYIPQGGQFNLNETINFTNQSQNATSYHWNFGINNDTSNVLNPSYGYATNGTFTVTLISSAAGCADTISYDFEIIGTPVRPVVVPTAFSPNGDGINDVFSILGGPFKTYQLTVYNEWGQEIFTSNEQIDGWDGSYKGNNQPTGSYVYVFNGITIVDEIIKLHGEIAIVK